MIEAPSPPLHNDKHHKWDGFGKETPNQNRFVRMHPENASGVAVNQRRENPQGIGSLSTPPVLFHRSRVCFEPGVV